MTTAIESITIGVMTTAIESILTASTIVGTPVQRFGNTRINLVGGVIGATAGTNRIIHVTK